MRGRRRRPDRSLGMSRLAALACPVPGATFWLVQAATGKLEPGASAMQDTELEKTRARYGLLAVIISNVAIAVVAIFGVWRLDGDKSVMVGVLTAAFTAVSSMTTAYLGIKAVSNTAKAMATRDLPATATAAQQQNP
ncbi:hypothetical protein SY2F82_55750 [Streptomyces sp. Y2F8-2]|nr:hypothetical protein SY2F82_55750 [Streptomyces sp. Y2F8-2]